MVYSLLHYFYTKNTLNAYHSVLILFRKKILLEKININYTIIIILGVRITYKNLSFKQENNIFFTVCTDYLFRLLVTYICKFRLNT